MMPQLDLSQYQNKLSRRNQILRLLWSVVWTVFARPLPRSLCSGWKRFLLRCFGAKIHPTARIYSTANIYAPWNLVMEEYSCIAPEVDCYSVDKVIIGAHATVSQKAYLCTASHNVESSTFPLITAPIIIKDQAWIAADAFIGMGVTVGEGAIVGARACVFKDVEQWTVVGGNPAKFIKKREIKNT
jgi:putative colanic acid biosynthesis acetyltransferase WcaF